MEQIETKTSIFTEKSGSMVYVLGKQDSVLNQYIYEMRDAGIQQDSMRFRINMERAAMLLCSK